jgi:hypothetical protein
VLSQASNDIEKEKKKDTNWKTI